MTSIHKENSSEVRVSVLDDQLLMHVGENSPTLIDSPLLRNHVLKLIRSGLQLTAEIRECRSIVPVKLLVVSVPTSRKVAIALPPASDQAATAALLDHSDIAACAVQNFWWPNLAAGDIPPSTLHPRYAQIRGLLP